MKKTILKRLISFLMVVIVLITTTNVGFAVDISNATQNPQALSTICLGNNISTISSDFNEIVRDTVQPGGELELYPPLDSYIGFNKKFMINASSESKEGILFVFLFKPNGELASNDWIITVNGVVEWSLFLPPSGLWKLKVVAQGADKPVEVFARWE